MNYKNKTHISPPKPDSIILCIKDIILLKTQAHPCVFFDIVKFRIHNNKFNKTMILDLEHHIEFLVTGPCNEHLSLPWHGPKFKT